MFGKGRAEATRERFPHELPEAASAALGGAPEQGSEASSERAMGRNRQSRAAGKKDRAATAIAQTDKGGAPGETLFNSR